MLILGLFIEVCIFIRFWLLQGERSPRGAKVKNKEEGRQPSGATVARSAGALSFGVPSAAALRFRTQHILEWVFVGFFVRPVPHHSELGGLRVSQLSVMAVS